MSDEDRELYVEFDIGNEVFLPGQTISGRVKFQTEEKYKARAVNIKFEGKAYTPWDEYESRRYTDSNGQTQHRRERIPYHSTVIFAEVEKMLWSNSNDENIMKPGSYVWPFSFDVPPYCPPSFEGDYGYIRYSVKAEVDRPWRFDDTKKRCVTVSPWLDLNQNAGAFQPLHDQDIENIGCCCFKKGFVEIKVDIPKSGFVAGETIPIHVHVLNRGTVPVNMVTAKVYQNSKYTAARRGSTIRFNGLGTNLQIHGSTERKEQKSKVAESEQKLDIQPGSQQPINLTIQLPSIPPSISQNSPTISVDYTIRVEVDTDATFNSSAKCELPLLIGTVPILQYLPPAVYPNNPADGPTLPQPINPPAIPSAPPLYEDSFYGPDGTKIDQNQNSGPFAPKYPVYNDLPIYTPTAPPME